MAIDEMKMIQQFTVWLFIETGMKSDTHLKKLVKTVSFALLPQFLFLPSRFSPSQQVVQYCSIQIHFKTPPHFL